MRLPRKAINSAPTTCKWGGKVAAMKLGLVAVLSLMALPMAFRCSLKK